MATYLTTRQRRSTQYRKRVSGATDKWAFLAFFAMGAAAIIALKKTEVHQVIVTFVPVLILLTYGFGTLAFKRLQLREDQTGDNCYYLGFLYTLVSLAYALFQFQTSKGGTEGIIGSFGIALSTTISGLFLRVFINQFRQDPVEIEREARLELGEAASRLRSQLDSTVLDLNSFRRSLQKDPLTQLLRAGARRLLTEAVEVEVEAFGAAHADFADEAGRGANLSQQRGAAVHGNAGLAPIGGECCGESDD